MSHTPAVKSVARRQKQEFDPFAALIWEQEIGPKEAGEMNLRTLEPFQRVLLTIDGTVTKFIEAYMLEPVEITRISQKVRRLPRNHHWLEAAEGTDVVAREVVITGRYSREVYTYAVSLIVTDRLDSGTRKALEVDGDGLGRILQRNRMETFREILWVGRQKIRLNLNMPGLSDEIDVISRMYRILSDNHVLMLISEHFPSSLDWRPRHH